MNLPLLVKPYHSQTTIAAYETRCSIDRYEGYIQSYYVVFPYAALEI